MCVWQLWWMLQHHEEEEVMIVVGGGWWLVAVTIHTCHTHTQTITTNIICTCDNQFEETPLFASKASGPKRSGHGHPSCGLLFFTHFLSLLSILLFFLDHEWRSAPLPPPLLSSLPLSFLLSSLYIHTHITTHTNKTCKDVYVLMVEIYGEGR